MPVIPVINKDLTQVTKEFNDKIHEPKHQRNLVLIIVCIALLLDNMLYMVIVPIIPEYLQAIDSESGLVANRPNTVTQAAYANRLSTILSNVDPKLLSKDQGENEEEEESEEDPKTTTKKVYRGRVMVRTTSTINKKPNNLLPIQATKKPASEEGSEDVAVGFLFASKAMVQLFVNPFSGAFIDRVGYDMPMCIGLGIIFLSTMTFSFGGSYFVLFLARSLQGVGSAFADTSGLAMVADRFTEEGLLFIFWKSYFI